MNVFVDLGCYNGDSVEEFRNWSKIAFPTKSDWEIYAFDPNPQFRKEWAAIANVRTHFENKAAWVQDGSKWFSVENSDKPIGSTLMQTKNTWVNGNKIEVETFDFSDWLKEFEEDYVVVKMDIEGAEFPVLDKMIEDGTHLIPEYLMVEFHPNKVSEYTTTDKNNLISKLKRDGVNILEWH